jgi:hypothetical protein
MSDLARSSHFLPTYCSKKGHVSTKTVLAFCNPFRITNHLLGLKVKTGPLMGDFSARPKFGGVYSIFP